MTLLFRFSVIILFTCTSIFAQEKSKLALYEDSLKGIQHVLFKSRIDKEKLERNKQFKLLFATTLNQPNSFEYPFDSLKEVGIIISPDKYFRIINWNIPMSDGTQQYFGYLQVFQPKLKSYQLLELTDHSLNIKNAENHISDHQKWFGMLYYKIIVVKHKKKKYYTLLGWDGNDKLTTKKIVDVLTFQSDGTPRFGADIFKLEKKSVKRVIFEYSAQAVMSLKYDEDKKLIVFDHLAPSQSKLEGQYQYYGPDFSFDALEFKKGKWEYIPDIDARNEKNKNDNQYKDPKDNGTNFENKKLYNPVIKK